MAFSDMLTQSRTLLANERTFLAYLRTALSLIVAGMSFLKFFQLTYYLWIGRGFIFVGGIIFLSGVNRFIKTKKIILEFCDKNKRVSK